MTRKIFVSSANINTGLITIDGISFTNRVNNKGPSTEPWETSIVTGIDLGELFTGRDASILRAKKLEK